MNKGYNDKKAVQAAAIFTQLEGGTIDKYKLCKLLYYLERQTILTTGQPLFQSELFSVPLGPISSEVNDGINSVSPSPKFKVIYDEDQFENWIDHFYKISTKKLGLLNDPGDDMLSEADIELIKEISEKFSGWGFKQLKEFFHGLPEHTETDSRIPIPIEKILREEGISEEEIQELIEEYQYYVNLISA